MKLKLEDLDEGVIAQSRRRQAGAKAVLRPICDEFGYGAALHLISKMWNEKDEAGPYPTGGHFVVGPCAALTVDCWCPGADPHCDYCNGCGWLTEGVAKLLKAQGL